MKMDEKLIYLRKENNLSQMQLSEKLGVSRQAISRWEVGVAVPSTDNLKFLSSLYGVPIDFLLDDKMELTNKDDRKIKDNEKKIRDKKMAVLFSILLLAVVIVVCTVVHGKQNEEVTHIGEMKSEEMYDSDGSFSIGW